MSISKENLNRYFQMALIIIAAGSIYPLVYLRQNFEVPILQTFGTESQQLLGYYSMIGIMFFVGYVPSGWLADLISPKLLLSLSMLATGLLGLVFAQIPDSKYLLYIFLGWGFSTVFTFWAAHLKCVKALAKSNEQGRFFGALDGGKGLVEALLATIAIGIFAWTLGGKGVDVSAEITKAGLVRVIYMYSFTCIVLSLLVFIFLDSDTKQTEGDTNTIEVKGNIISNMILVLKIPEVWLVAGILFCGYHLFWSTYSFSGYLQMNFKTGTVIAGYITVAKLWMRPIGGFGAGWLGDRYNNALVLGIAMLIAGLSLILFAYIPGLNSLYFLVFMVLFIGLVTYAIRGLYWAILGHCNLPLSITGFAIGFISLVGYSGDILIPKANQIFVSKYGNLAGVQNYYIYTAIIGLIGACLSFYLYHRIKNKQQN